MHVFFLKIKVNILPQPQNFHNFLKTSKDNVCAFFHVCHMGPSFIPKPSPNSNFSIGMIPLPSISCLKIPGTCIGPTPIPIPVSVWMFQQYRYRYESSVWYRYRYECSVCYRYRYGGITGTLTNALLVIRILY